MKAVLQRACVDLVYDLGRNFHFLESGELKQRIGMKLQEIERELERNPDPDGIEATKQRWGLAPLKEAP